MVLPLPDLPVGILSVTYSVAAVASAIFVVAKLFHQPSKLVGIPTVGSSSWVGSWLAAYKYQTNASDIIREGYEKYKPAPFKVAELHGWSVILTSCEHMEEVQRASEDTISFTAAKHEVLQSEYTFGAEITHNPYHIPIIRSQLTRNIGVLYPDIRNEVIASFDDVLDLRGNEWKTVPAFSSIQKVVCRVSNRVFVGLPLCRNPDWIDLNIRFTMDAFKAGSIVRLFPKLLKSIVARLFMDAKSLSTGRKIIGPMIEERLKSLKEHGNEWTDKPTDYLTWLMEKAEGPELTIERLTTRLMLVNVAAVHTSSNSFTHALFYLATHPQYVQPLREEVETIVKNEGWSKIAMNKMHKVDSFLRESQRLEGVSSLSLMRKALKDYTFSDGTFVPKDTMMFAASRCIHHDETFYENADTFEPFRFSDMREKEGEGVKYHFVSTTHEYLPFGHGRYACPGRFFVANELKSMLAHIVVTYDVKLAEDASPPQPLRLGASTQSDPRAKVMFRRRVD